MPELPEVETVRRGLNAALAGKALAEATVHEPRLRWPIPAAQKRDLEGAFLKKIERRSKYLLFRFDRGTLLAHLGMTGSFWVYKTAAPPRKTHDHVEWMFDDGTLVRYNDPRRFGSLHWIAGENSHPLLDALGPEPLTDAFTGKTLHDAFRNRSAPIKSAIMDNHVVVGVGNIYANESLFRAGIHPNRAAKRVSAARCDTLAATIKMILAEAIDAGGSTLRDFVNSEGEPGAFQLRYFVYAREGAPCKECAREIRLMRHNGRATFYCSQCQR
jgi:formamidopyrimidine-DNA glycosylase